jgi:hypothetical protein
MFYAKVAKFSLSDVVVNGLIPFNNNYRLFTTLRIPFFIKTTLKFISKPNLQFVNFK